MKNARMIVLFVLCLCFNALRAQEQIDLTQYSFTTNDLEGKSFGDLMNGKLQNSRFVFVGEQHGIKSAAEVTSLLYSLGKAYGYNTLCLETDKLAADKIQSMAASGNFTAAMKKHYEAFPYTIPFYNNTDDHVLFDNVQASGGDFWGIDQTFMVQHRFTLHHLATTGSSKKLKKHAATLKKEADAAYANAVANKDYKGPFLFKYDKEKHDALMALTQTGVEKELVNQLWKTKEIYEYYYQRKNYLNNEVRGQLMKSNFMRYWNEARTAGKDPKVIFKLGANHAARGLTRTNIYDIANMGSELAISQGERSVHVAVLGITGKMATGNPFAPAPAMDFDNTKQLPDELKKLVENMTDKYFVIDLEALREFGYGKGFSEAFKDNLFQYDVIVLVNGAEAVGSF